MKKNKSTITHVCLLTVFGAAVIALSGCTAVTYTKSISVKKDALGKVVEQVEFESITEPHSESGKINFNYLKR